MQRLKLENVSRIRQNKKLLEEKIKIKINLRGGEVTIEGEADKEYLAEKILSALSFGFDIDDALLLLRDGFMYDEMQIKSVTNRNNKEQVRARIIGTQGRALNTMMTLTDSYILLRGNTVAFIAPVETFETLKQAMESLIRGSKHSNIYKFLEDQRAKLNQKADEFEKQNS